MTDHDSYLTKARTAAARVINEQNDLEIADVDDPALVKPGDLYVVWFAKTLQNWKALVSTDKADGLYYEVTHNGDAGETYVDTYEKQDNRVVPDSVFTEIFPHIHTITL